MSEAENDLRSRSRPEPRAERRKLLTALVLIDATALALAVSLAGLLRLVLDEVVPVANLGWEERHLVASVLSVPFLLLLFQFEGLYDLDHILAGTREYARIAQSATYGLILVLAASYLAGGPPLVSRSWLLLVWVLSIGFVVVGRFSLRRAVRRMRRSGALRSRVVIVGASTLGIAIADQVRGARDEGLDVVGFLDEYLPLGQPLSEGIEVIGRPRDLLRGSMPKAADEYILIPQAIPHERLEEITHLMVSRGGPTLRMAVSPSGLLTNWVSVAERGGVPLVTLRRARLGPLERALKYAVDATVATLGLLILAPAALAAATRAYILGRRPLLSTFPIQGAGGVKFTFRVFNADVVPWLPLRGVPALLSVVSGRLSLVGPRPLLWAEGVMAPRELSLTTMKPGLTGRWRLRGPDASLSDQTIEDLTYVRNYSMWEDIRILLESMRRLRGHRLLTLLGRWQDQDQAQPSAIDAGVFQPAAFGNRGS
jgi:lipopolysaccharide/colanic/teichoic acid biosynthesis glycosyltransferase